MQRIVVGLVFLSLTLSLGCGKPDAPAPDPDQAIEAGPVAPVAAADLDPMIRELGQQGAVPQAIVVEMARPVVGLDKVGTDAEGFEIVSDPPIDGRAVYTSPSTISFQPTTPLLPGVSYTVRLAQIPTENGPLTPPTTEAWKRQLTTPNFNFLRLSLDSVDYRAGKLELDVSFSAPVSYLSVRDHAKFFLVDDQERETAVYVSRVAEGDTKNLVRFRLHSNQIRSGVNLLLRLEEGAHLVDDEKVLAPATEATLLLPKGDPVVTVRDLFPVEGSGGFLVEVVCDDGAVEGTRYYYSQANGRGFGRLSQRCILSADSADKVHIEPPVPFTLAPAGGGFRIFGDFPRGAYSIRIEAGARTEDGGEIRTGFEKAFSVPARSPMVSFVSQGRYLPRSAWASLPIRHRNVGAVEISIRHVPAQNLVYWMSDPDSESATERTSDLIAQHNYPLAGAADTAATTHLDVGSLVASDTRGLLELTLSSGEATAAARILLTDIQLIAKRTGIDESHPWGRAVHVWAFDAHELTPLSAVNLKLVRPSGKILVESATRTDGSAVLRLPPKGLDESPPFALIASQGNDLTYLEFEDLKTEVQEARVAGESYRGDKAYRAALYADRGVYRPGETAHLVVVLRNRDLVAPPSTMPVLLQLRDPRGQTVREDLKNTNTAGVVTLDPSFADFADTGTWSLQAKVGEDVVGTLEFLVEEFVPERLEVKATATDDGYLLGQDIAVDVSARYLFGGVPADHRVELTCELQPGEFSSSTYPNYTFGVWRPEGELAPLIELGRASGVLDADGGRGLVCAAPARSGGFEGPGQVLARAAVFEAGSGRTTVGRAVIPVHPAPYYLGLTSSAKEVAVGDPIRAQGVVVDWAGAPYSDLETVEVEFIRLEEEYGWYYDESVGYETFRRYLRPVPDQKIEAEVTGSQFAVEWTPQNYAQAYLVRATSGKARTDLRVEGRGGWYYWMPDESQAQRTPRPDRATWIELTTPKTVEVGEDVTVTFKAPYRGRALLTAETDDILVSSWREVEAGEVTWTFPLSGFQPNVYVTAMVIKDPHLDSEDAFVPDRSFGVKSIDVEPVDLTRALDLKVPEEVRSRAKLDVDLDLGPLDEPTWITVAAVDEGILSLTRFASPDPLRGILAQRALGVDTFETVGWSLVVPPGTPSSATGGDAGNALGRVQPIDPVALWSGLVEVPKSGKTRVSFDLPQYRGALRVMAVTLGGQRIGHADRRVIVRDPIVLQTTLPRFLARGDRAQIPVFLTNLSGASKSVDVTLEVTPLEVGAVESTLPSRAVVSIVGTKRKSLTLEEGAQGQVLFEVQAGSGVGAVTLTARMSSGNLTSEAEGRLAVLSAEPKTRRQQRVLLEEGETQLQGLLGSWEPMTERTTLWVTNNPYGDAFDHLKWLIRYPYGCIEQTISSTRPLLVVPKLLQRVDPELVAADKVDAMILAGIDRLWSMQTPEGGFAYWPGGNEPVDWGTANAVHLLLDAQEGRYPVSQNRIDRALSWMERQVTHVYEKGHAEDSWRSAGAEPYVHYVLAKAGRGRKARILELIQKIGTPKDGQAREHLFMLQAALYMAGDHRFESALRDPDVSSVVAKRSYGWSFYSDRRRRGFMLSTYVDLFGRQTEIEPLANLVAESLRGRPSSYYTTQELVWSTTGLGKFVEGRPADFAVPSLRAGTRTLRPDLLPEPTEDSKSPQNERTWNVYRASEYPSLTLDLPSKGEGLVYLVISSEGVSEPPAVDYGDHGLHLERRFLDPEGNPLGNTPDLELGQVLYIELTLRNDSPERIANLALVDRIPAGWEIENPRLGRSGTVEWFDADNAWEVEHLNLRDDRLEVFGHLEPREARRVLYAIRAVTAGSFTLPPAEAEAMYDPDLRSRLDGGTVRVRGPWSD
ncbi:MAG: hypothetical protein K8J08_08270 [Thermoanaerobaculia bacterium]|nr:hypothetical protein [Thermoanaerobaculia bacterium]